ncbi:MAG: HDIG domain-containing protein [Planctomycetaceae bacterium]
MSFFGTRRSRQTRVYRPTQSVWEKINVALQDYRVLTQLLLGLLAVLALLLATQSWRSRFTYRIGQFVSDGVLARVAFRVENDLETRRAKAEAMEDSPLFFTQQNDVLDSLTSTFRSQLTDLANAESIANLPAGVAEGFGLNPAADPDAEKKFSTLKKVLTESGNAVGDQVDQLFIEFGQLIAPTRLAGLLEASAYPQLNNAERAITPQQAIRIVNSEGELKHSGSLADILLADQLRDTGRLGRGWVELPVLKPLRPFVETWLLKNFKGQVTYDAATTETRRQQAFEDVETVFDAFPAGTVLVPPESRIEADQQRRLLQLEYEAYEAGVSLSERLVRVVAASLMLILLVVLFGTYLKRSFEELLRDSVQLLSFILICAFAVGVACLLSRDPWRAEIIPIMAAVMIVAIVYDQMLAILTAFMLCVLVSMSTVGQLSHFVVLMIICFVAVAPLRRVSSRSTLIKAGFLIAAVAFVSVWGISIVVNPEAAGIWNDSATISEGLKFAGWSLVCCYLVTGSLPFIESAFDIVTDISLLELTLASHPLLQELARRAPGTYNHSSNVAAIGEAAADAIGANGLLVRVGAHFHDIGKMVKPEYFIENMIEGQENQHRNLAPAMSALIIIGHVKDGSEMAEQHNLPQKLIDFIEQHHGTTLVQYFYHEATMRLDQDHRTDAEESTFRYPGPRPQTRETGVMMLADAVESASRSLSEPTPKRIQSLVREITLKRLLDGQFDECGLKMSELRIVQESLVKSLLAIHHGRIKYPDQKPA